MVRRTDGRTDIPTDKDEQSDILVVCTQIAKWTDMDGRTMRHTSGLYTDSKMDWKKTSARAPDEATALLYVIFVCIYCWWPFEFRFEFRFEERPTD